MSNVRLVGSGLKRLATCCACLAIILGLRGCGGEAATPSSDEPVFFHLHTEFFPVNDEPGVSYSPLGRELGRQAVLIAARDELGLVTRDETLGESFEHSADQKSVAFGIDVRPEHDGWATITLRHATEGASGDGEASPAGAFRCRYQPDTYNMHTGLAKVLGAASRTELVDILREAGCNGPGAKLDPEGQLPPGVEAQLQEMSFVAQYAALRKIHQAIRTEGESPARIGGLVRGYANLSMLTRHHWTTSSSVFAARALLYAERLIALQRPESLPLHHQAYARALLGLHGMALQALSKVSVKEEQTLRKDPPAWTHVIRPYCLMNSDELTALASEPGIRQLAHQLAFDIKTYYLDERMVVVAGRIAIKECPESYGIYSDVAALTPMLSERQAVAAAAEMFGLWLPRSVARIEDLPESVYAPLREETHPSRSIISSSANAGGSRAHAWSPLPHDIAQSLCSDVKANGDAGEPSWNVLAELIAEEQFAQVATFLSVSLNAVEYSRKPLVDQVAPLVEGHKYLPYIQSFALNRARGRDEIAKLAGDIRVVDPRPVMFPMINLFDDASDANGTAYSQHYHHGFYNYDYRLHEMAVALHCVSNSWWQMAEYQPHFQRRVLDLKWISPHAPTGLRIEINSTVDPRPEQLADWEQRAENDPRALYDVGQLHIKNRDYPAAIRCFERSYSCSPNSERVMALADAYRDNGDSDRWQPTLERYLKEEDYALGHASVHQWIAEQLISEKKWSEAEPHALSAAETWSAWGLVLASRVYEGLGRWEESERYIREAVESYPTHSGHEWYFWCRRTGRGDRAQARRYFDEFLTIPSVQQAANNENYMFVDEVLEGRYEQALHRIQANPEYENTIYWQTHVALLAKRLGNEALYASAMNNLVQKTEEQFKESDPVFCSVIQRMHGLQQRGTLTDSEFQEIEELLAKFVIRARCNYYYFVGEQLALHGESQRAETCWRRALETGQGQVYNATFAGDRLAANQVVAQPDQPKTDDDEARVESGTL